MTETGEVKVIGREFGKSVEAYEKGRQRYPHKIINYIDELMDYIDEDDYSESDVDKKSDALFCPGIETILDIGCGTGIATRQLAEMLTTRNTELGYDNDLAIYGCDVDPKMIEAARKHNTDKITIPYILASPQNMLFPDYMFDGVTAFSAFHWFYDNKSIEGIKRVLKRGGVFIIVHRDRNRETNGYEYEALIEEVMGTSLPDEAKMSFVNAQYHPTHIVINAGFRNTTYKKLRTSQIHSVEEEVTRMLSMSIWSATPDDVKQKALEIFEKRLRTSSFDGYVQRTLEWDIVSGRK